MDNFFLRPTQRTPNRLREPGGNIDYERFYQEIIDLLKSDKPFAYRPYNCRTGELTSPIPVIPNAVNVIEGVYSLHPRFRDKYDIKVFFSIDENEQLRRLLRRNPDLHKKFIHEWVPMENIYFEDMKIPDICDFVFDTSSQDYIKIGGSREGRNN